MNKNEIKKLIRDVVLKKLETYKPETEHKPFHYRLIGKDKMALFSFIHSINTSLGQSIYEQIALLVSKEYFKVCKTQVIVGDLIYKNSQNVIGEIINNLQTSDSIPDKNREFELIKSTLSGEKSSVKKTKVDLYLEDYENNIYCIDVKTAKPNKDGFIKLKQTLLEWTAISLVNKPNYKIHCIIAIPYNPYYPKDYERWTMKGLFDIKKELKVAEEFWNFLSLNEEEVYNNLLDCFEEVGKELKPKIDNFFKKIE